MTPFTLLIKPSGSDCNLDCSYCFYKRRSPQIGAGQQRMSEQVLERLIKDYLQLGFPVAGFAWQGGEPTLMGLDFYQKAVELQKKYALPNQQTSNSLQTTAVLLDEKWCQFLHDNNFLVGISIDGPGEFHDYYRTDRAGKGTFGKVARAIDACVQHKVEFNVLVLLNNKNVRHPDELFDFFVKRNIRYLQFIPCAEKDPAAKNNIAEFSISPKQYGDFLCRLFDRWCEYGPAKLSIRDFDSILSFCLTGRGTLCTFDRQCSQYIVVEHDGSCFPCDFFVEPDWLLGNILETPIAEIAACDKKKSFARDKQNLCNRCLVCAHLAVCRGGCTKDKILSADKKTPAAYFCESYRRFFNHAMPKFLQIAANLKADANRGKNRLPQ